MDGVQERLDIGMRVRTEFVRRGEVAGLRFRLEHSAGKEL
jgi:hypothetical protein